jgi:hypothetical protein
MNRIDRLLVLVLFARNPIHDKAAREAFLPLSRRILFYDCISE